VWRPAEYTAFVAARKMSSILRVLIGGALGGMCFAVLAVAASFAVSMAPTASSERVESDGEARLDVHYEASANEWFVGMAAAGGATLGAWLAARFRRRPQ